MKAAGLIVWRLLLLENKFEKSAFWGFTNQTRHDIISSRLRNTPQPNMSVLEERKMFRNDTYTGGNHFWIRFYNGQHEVRMETDYCEDDNVTVFTGSYESCVNYIKDLVVANADYDMNL